MANRLTLGVMVLAVSCSGDGGVTGPAGAPVAAVATSPTQPQTAEPPIPAVETAPNLFARFEGPVCRVTNQTGREQPIRLRVSRVHDRGNPTDTETQELVADSTTPVPDGAAEFPVRAALTVPLCQGYYQFDCGRGEGLLAYTHVGYSNSCRQPPATPVPGPVQAPCIDTQAVHSTFNVDSLSDGGTGFFITDDGVTIPRLSNLTLAAGVDVASYALPADGSRYCLRWPSGGAYEEIGCAIGSCPAGPQASWHGTVSFGCERQTCP